MFTDATGRSAKEQLILSPHETVMYTWDDPAGSRSLWWSVISNVEKCTKPISLTKVHVTVCVTVHVIVRVTNSLYI